MNLNQWIRLQFLIVFALLQCVAPVAHAHVSGHHAGQHVHLAYIDHLAWDVHPTDLPHISVETDHSSVVGMPPEYRPAEQSAGQALEVGDEWLLALREYAVPQFVALPRQVLPFFPYQHPCSQAPPA